MVTPLIDTHATVKKLSAAGMSEAEAEAAVEILSTLTAERLATKDDLEALKTELAAELKAEWRNDLRELEVRIGDRLRAQMLWFFTMLVGLLAVTVAVRKFLP